MRIGLLGFGTVGSAFAEVLAASGNEDVRITHVFNRGVERKRGHERAKFVATGAVWTERVEDVLEAADVDVVVELMGGLDPVEGWLRAALGAGKHVVTANKQLIAYRGAELFALAAEKGVPAAVCSRGGWWRAGDSGDCAGAERRCDHADQRDCEWDL